MKRIPDGNPGDVIRVEADRNYESNIGDIKEDTIKVENNHLMKEIHISVFRPNGEEIFCYKTNLMDSKYC